MAAAGEFARFLSIRAIRGLFVRDGSLDGSLDGSATNRLTVGDGSEIGEVVRV